MNRQKRFRENFHFREDIREISMTLKSMITRTQGPQQQPGHSRVELFSTFCDFRNWTHGC